MNFFKRHFSKTEHGLFHNTLAHAKKEIERGELKDAEHILLNHDSHAIVITLAKDIEQLHDLLENYTRAVHSAAQLLPKGDAKGAIVHIENADKYRKEIQPLVKKIEHHANTELE